jgi:hypothetical protein
MPEKLDLQTLNAINIVNFEKRFDDKMDNIVDAILG